MTPLFLLVLVGAYKLQEGVTPVQKVITMMNEMSAKGKEEMATEATQHEEYMGWCKQTAFEKEVAIRDGNLALERLAASGEKANADADKLGDEIVALNDDINQWGKEKKEATDLRNQQHADFTAVHNEYNENLEAMAQSISTMAAKSTGSISDSFLQEVSQSMTTKGMARLQALVQPKTSSFEFSGGGVLDIVKDLEAKMSEERAVVEREEADVAGKFAMLEQQLTANIEQATEEMDSKTELKSTRKADAATDLGDHTETLKAKNADEKYLAELTAQCQTKASEFPERQQLRKEELEALAKATEIISSGAVSGAADKHLPALVQSFGLLRSTVAAPLRKKIAAFLQERATKSNSRMLALAAAQVQQGPFDKVAGMIEDMIAKLTAEAADEADHKEWCDTELASNKQMREAKTSEVDRLTALSEQLNAEIDRLTRETADLASQINDLQKALNEATTQRSDEKAANTAAVADANAAIEAVRKATSVLKEFYSKAAAATSFAQVHGPADDAPTSWSSSQNGQQSASTGVMGMLEVILTDFTRLESSTSSSEAEAADEFRSFSGSTNDDISAKTDSSDGKKKEMIKKNKELNQATRDMRSTHEELDSAMSYFSELKPACVDADVSFSERVTRRQDEIDSLNDTLKILSTEQ